MIKNILAVTTVVFALGACSSSSDSNSDSDNGGTDGTTDGTTGGGTDGGATDGGSDGGDTGSLPPATDTKAGTYLGDFGFGEGVYVIDNENRLSGLAVAADGSANSLFGSVGSGNAFNGTLNSYFHSASVADAPGNFGPGPSGDGAAPTSVSVNVNIVNGQTIENADSSISLVGSVGSAQAPATPATVAGSWVGEHSFCCLEDETNVLRTEITFSGNNVNGRTVILRPDGTERSFSPSITGTISEFGDVSLLEFEWNEYQYDGVIFFRPGTTDELVFIGEATGESTGNEEGPLSNLTIGSLLTR